MIQLPLRMRVLQAPTTLAAGPPRQEQGQGDRERASAAEPRYRQLAPEEADSARISPDPQEHLPPAAHGVRKREGSGERKRAVDETSRQPADQSHGKESDE